MFNINSPIVQNMLQQGQGQPCPSNVVDIGNGYTTQPMFYNGPNPRIEQSGVNEFQAGLDNEEELKLRYRNPEVYTQSPIGYQTQARPLQYNQRPGYYNPYHQPQYNGYYQQPQTPGYQPVQFGFGNLQQQRTGSINPYAQYIQNSGYYGNSMNGYGTDPYWYRQQQQIAYAQQREHQRNQVGLWMQMSKAVHSYFDDGVTDEQIAEMYDPEVRYQNERNNFDIDAYNNEHLLANKDRFIEGNVYALASARCRDSYLDMRRKQFPEDITLKEFVERSSELFIEIEDSKMQSQKRNLGGLYNESAYNEYLQQHRKSCTFFTSAFKDAQRRVNNGESVDEINVTLPSHMAQVIKNREKAFYASIGM